MELMRSWALEGELREDVGKGLARHLDFRAHAHAAAHIDEDCQAHGSPSIGSQPEHRSQLTVIPYLKIGRSQVTQWPAVFITD